ncbi:MAG: hypothetical protein AAF646_12580 [Pseudomonadota bacterium]
MTTLTDQQVAFLTRYLAVDRAALAGPAAVHIDTAGGPRPITHESNKALDQLTPDQLDAADLTRRDPDTIFTDDYMEDLKDTPIKGEGDPKLKDLMREIVNGIFGERRSEVMIALAGLIGIPPTAEKLDVDYGRFLIIRKQQMVKGTKKDDGAPALDEEMHPEFMASRGQLLFGKVLGDAFGIHEVFAALLSPTGGLVGANNNFAPGIGSALHLDPDNPIALHGVVHDAAGYLHTFHDTGPGYNYLNSKLEIFGDSSPFSGQLSGVVYWIAEAGDEYVLERLDDAVTAVEKGLGSVRDAIAAGIDDLLGLFRRKKDEAVETVDQAVMEVANAIEDASNAAKESATEAYDRASTTLGDALADGVKKKLDAISSFVWG